MEKRTETGMRPEDFSGFCTKCPVDCQEDIVKLISKFCQGICIEATSGSLPSSIAFRPEQRAAHYGDDLNYWPSFSSSGGNDEGGSSSSNILEVTTEIEAIPGDIRVGFGVLYKEIGNVRGGHATHRQSGFDNPDERRRSNPLNGPRTDPATGDWGTDYNTGRPVEIGNQHPDPVEWGYRNTDHIDSISGISVNKEEAIYDHVEGVPDFATKSVITTIEKIDLYLKEENFSIFPVCGDLQVKDSGDDYISVQVAEDSGWGQRPDGSYGERHGDTSNGEALFILISSDCPDPHPARSSEHPHMVGRSTEPTYTKLVSGVAAVVKNPHHSDEREFDNVEQKKYLGMSRLTYVVPAGSVYKTTISGLSGNEFVEGEDEVYYTSIHPKAETVPLIRKGYFGDIVYQGPLDIDPSPSEITQHNLCDAETAGGSYNSYGHWIPNKSSPEFLLEVQRKVYIGLNEGHQKPPTFQQQRDLAMGRESDYVFEVIGRGDDEAYCSWKPGDLAPFNAKQKKYIFDNLQDAIDAQGKLMKSSRQKIQSNLDEYNLQGLVGPVGCNKSKILAFGHPVTSSSDSRNAALNQPAGTKFIKSDSLSWVPLTEAFDINGSMLHNRSETEGFDLSNQTLTIASSASSQPQLGVPQPKTGLVGITFYKAELSYRDFEEKAEMKESYDLDFEEIYSRSFGGFSAGATIPDGYGTGGYMKKANLDTPEKALLAWSRVGDKADLHRAGYYYRFFQENYYYDVTQEKNDFGFDTYQYPHDKSGVINPAGYAFSSGRGVFNADSCNGVGITSAPYGKVLQTWTCDPPDVDPIPSAAQNRKYRDVIGPRDQLSSRIFTGGKTSSNMVSHMNDPYRKSAYWPPRFDEGQRVHGDGTVDFDTFSHAIIDSTYTEDPNNPDTTECIPDFSGWPSYGPDFCYATVDGRQYNGKKKITRNGTIGYAFAERFRCLAEAAGLGPPEPDKYDYYVYRQKVQVVEAQKYENDGKWIFDYETGRSTPPERIDMGPFSFPICANEKVGWEDKWPATELVGTIMIARYKLWTADGVVEVAPWEVAGGCTKCMGEEFISSSYVWCDKTYSHCDGAGPLPGYPDSSGYIYRPVCKCNAYICEPPILQPYWQNVGGNFFKKIPPRREQMSTGYQAAEGQFDSPYQKGYMWYTSYLHDVTGEKDNTQFRIDPRRFTVVSGCCCHPLFDKFTHEYAGCADEWSFDESTGWVVPQGPPEQVDLSLLGCKIIRIEKPISASGSVDLGDLSVKISLK